MQTERVTFLTSPGHKAALDAFAATSGRSVGHVLREASSQYIAREPTVPDDYEEALDLVLPELEAMLVTMNARLDNMRANIVRACEAVDAALAGDPA